MTNQDSTRSIAANAKRFFSGTLISRITGLGREVVMAAAFGTHPAIAAFWMAFRFAHLLRRIFGEGALHAVFVPHFESLRKENPARGARFFYDLSTGVALLLFFLALLVEGILGGSLLFGSISEANRDVVRLTMIMLPAVVFISLYALNHSLLNCERVFFLPSAAPSALNILWMIAVIWLWKKPQKEAIDHLAMVIVFAFALQWLVTLPQVIHYLKKEMGEKINESRFSAKEMLQLLRPFSLGMLGVAATQINSALDALFARAADPEGPAYLWYALRIQQLPLALVGVALTGALLPPMSRALQSGAQNDYFTFLKFAVERAVLFLLPMTTAMLVLGFSGIDLVYGHGSFSHRAIIQTTTCLWAYGSALLPMTLVLIFASAFYAQKNYKTPTIAACLSVLLNTLLNAMFVYIFHLGSVSIALATAGSACFNCFLLARSLRLDRLLYRLLPYTFKVLIVSVTATVITLFFGYYLHDNTLPFATHKNLLFPQELLSQIYLFASQAAVYGGVFLLLAYLLNLKVFSHLRPSKNI